MNLNASPTACNPVVQAVDTAWFGPCEEEEYFNISLLFYYYNKLIKS
jgi:hypothetical protein